MPNGELEWRSGRPRSFRSRAEPAAAASADAILQVVDRSRLAQGTYFGAQSLRDLPNGAGVSALVDAAAPFVIVDRMDTGGLGLGIGGRVGSRAASSTSSSLVLGEFPVASSSRSADQLIFMPELSTVDAVNIASGLASADLAQPGATMTLVPRRPPTARHGAVDLGFTGPDWFPATTESECRRLSVSRRGGRRSAVRRADIDKRRSIRLRFAVRRMRKQERDAPARIASHVNSCVCPRGLESEDAHQFGFLGSVQGVGRPYGGHPEFLNTNVTEQDLFGQVAGDVGQWRANGSLVEAAVGYQRGAFTPSGALDAGTSIDRVINGVVPAPVANDYDRPVGGASGVRTVRGPSARAANGVRTSAVGIPLPHAAGAAGSRARRRPTCPCVALRNTGH